MNGKKKYDLIVLGGGYTGCAAALAAARDGKKVLLIEAEGHLGGAAANCMVYPFMRYYTRQTADDGSKTRFDLSRGIFAELVAEMNRGYSDELREHGGFSDEVMKVVLDRKLTEAGVSVLFHATLCGVRKRENHILSVSVATKAGVLSFRADVFADCTGDADLCTYAGVPTVLGREQDHLCQPMTLCFRVVNVDMDEFYAHLTETQQRYKEWREAGKLENPREDILVFRYRPVEKMLHFNTTRVVKRNPVDPFDLSAAEMEARRQVMEMMNFMKENHIPGMENAQLVGSASSIGVRESRMLDGVYRLTGDDLVACTKFPDAIAAGNYDIDIHNPEGAGTSHHYFEPGTWYTIPYRALLPKPEDADNLVVAGRCISCTHEAQASVRIMPICCTTGEAAGIAASVACESKTTVQNVDVREVQRRLNASGAYVGF